MALLPPLPECEGPKLAPFTHDITAHDIEFLDVLSSESGLHGVIAKVKIDGRIYCLKLFKEEEPHGGFFRRPKWAKPDATPTSPTLQLNHNNTFYCECRAFGRLQELGREDLAVRAYGYISLPMTEDMTTKMHRAMIRRSDWARSCPELSDVRSLFSVRDGPDDGLCVMGIVKDWVDVPADAIRTLHWNDLPIPHNQSILRRMLADVKAFHRCGIVVCDIRLCQWVGSTFVDFSMAMTIPHMCGPGGESNKPSRTFASIAAYDLRCFQIAIYKWNGDRWSEFYPTHPTSLRRCTLRAYDVRPPGNSVVYKDACGVLQDIEAKRIRERLRPRDIQHGPFLPLLNRGGEKLDLIELPPYDPGKFDWRAAEAAGRERRKRRELGQTTPPRSVPSRTRGKGKNEVSTGLKRKRKTSGLGRKASGSKRKAL